MLILVAVTVNVAVNSGLFGHAKNATSDWKAAEEQEGSIGNGPITINGKEYASMEEYLKEVGNGGTPAEPEKPLITAGERATENSRYQSDEKTAIIPAKFTVSGLASEQSIEGGLVIYLIPEGTTVDWTNAAAVKTAQETYDQFVWIPIENINDMYMCQAKTSDTACNITLDAEGKPQCTTHSSSEPTKSKLMAGRLYATTYGENFDTMLTTQTYTDSDICEPDVVTKYDTDANLNNINSILGTNYTAANFKSALQEEYNEIVKSVYENHGFYVGRYETSSITETDGTAIKSVAGAIPSNKINWYYEYAQQRDYATNKGLEVGSTMIQGAAYDQVMKFVNTANYDVKAKTNVGHKLSSSYQTGGKNYPETDKDNQPSTPYNDTSKNIFDLEGNVQVWTTETYTANRVDRGGHFGRSSSASSRSYSVPSGSSSIVSGSVSQLYVK